MQSDSREELSPQASKSAAEYSARLSEQIGLCVRSWDPHATVRLKIRPDGKLDITIISGKFEELDSRSREEQFWQALDSVPQLEMIYLTYGLLLTPQEAAHEFSETPNRLAIAEDWDE